MSLREKVLNAFTPNQEVSDPEAFAGRREAVLDGVDALHGRGTTPIIYGERGVGKTSLATQLSLIAMGHQVLLDYFGMADRGFNEDSGFVVVWADCSKTIKETSGILERIEYNSRCYVNPAGITGTDTVTRSTSTIDLRIYKSEEMTETRHSATHRTSPEDRLAHLLEEIAKKQRKRVLVVVDELDVIENTAGLGSFIKTRSSDDIKFLLVGVADNVSNLIDDHESITRQLKHIKLPKMRKGELVDIVTKAEARIKQAGVDIAFDEAAKSRLAQIAAGMPWFVHTIGKSALVRAFSNSNAIVSDADISKSVDDFASNEFAHEFSDLYGKCVKDSLNREVVLRVMAGWGNLDIPTSQVYRICQGLGVTNPSVYKNHLTQAAYGDVIYSMKGQRSVRFRNSLFKQYVCIRPSMFRGVSQKVRDAYAQRK